MTKEEIYKTVMNNLINANEIFIDRWQDDIDLLKSKIRESKDSIKILQSNLKTYERKIVTK